MDSGIFTPGMTCCFTGHRDIERFRYNEVGKRVEAEIIKLYDKGVRRFIAGGALGFDMICAVVAHNLRLSRPDIFLTLALPCRGHTKNWSASDTAQLDTLIRRADEVVYVSDKYDSGCMFRRNRFMVERSAYCISYCTRHSGGSYYTVSLARRLGLEIIEVSGADAADMFKLQY